METISERLKEERLRLGMTQLEMATAGGCKRQAQIRYESGDRSPDGDYFSAIAAAGADVNYILTGVRIPTVIDKQVEAAIKLFEGMDKKQREAALSAITNQERLKPVERLLMSA